MTILDGYSYATDSNPSIDSPRRYSRDKEAHLGLLLEVIFVLLALLFHVTPSRSTDGECTL